MLISMPTQTSAIFGVFHDIAGFSVAYRLDPGGWGIGAAADTRAFRLSPYASARRS